MPPARSRLDLALLVVRLALAVVFVPAGWMKLANLDGTAGFFALVGIPAPGVFAVLVGVAEFFGGLGIALGVLPRFSSLVLALNMVAAAWIVTFPARGWMGSRLEFVLAAASLAIAVAGTGRWAVADVAGRPELDVEERALARMRGR